MTSQSQVINKILQTKDFSIITANNLSEDYFFNYKSEFLYIKNHFDAYQAVPDELTFKSIFPDFDLYKVSEPDSYLLEQLIKDYNQSYLAKRFNEIKKLLEGNKIDEAVKYFLTSVDNLHSGPALTATDLVHDKGRYDRYMERTTDPTRGYISTGFSELDQHIGGIDHENENMVIVARTGRGKTWTLLKMAVAAVSQGLTVGLYSGEMTADKVGYRVDTLFGQLDNRAIMRGQLEVQKQYENYINDLPRQVTGNLYVVTPADIVGPPTVEALRGFIEKYKLDILFIDQYSLLEDTSRSRTTWEQVANISKAVKSLQVKTKIPIISVAQQNRTKNENGELDTTQIGLSDRIGQDATVVLMLDREDDKLIINITKARDGGENNKLEYACDFNFGHFIYLPQEEDGITHEDSFNDLEQSYEPDGYGGF